MSDDGEDPFDRLDDDPDRGGDPFDRLGRADEGDEGDGGDARDGRTDRDGVSLSDRADPTPPFDSETDDPFADVETPAGDPFDGPTGAFERVDVGGADPDAVWDAITGDEADDEPPSIAESRYVEVSKHEFCERCDFFSSPPEVACSHETAEIVEFVDVETVRLLDCPVVAERRQLEEGN